jgi:protoporphyrinogen oxidase
MLKNKANEHNTVCRLIGKKGNLLEDEQAMSRRAIIIGAGPAGLTAAYELLTRTDIVPLVIEMSDAIGGISRTVNYKGNRIDIGGHRFFSKSDRVMEWWLQRMPVQPLAAHAPAALDSNTADRVLLVRQRKSRIYFLRKFFNYPLQFSGTTVANLGLMRIAKITLSYGWSLLSASRKPKNLEEFFIQRFGRELYLTFFKSYTEKVWGESCARISAEWGAQRIKGLSIVKSLHHFLKSLFAKKDGSIGQKLVETSLIEQFLYPKFGPGQMWETVAEEIVQRGGTILMNHQATQLHVQEGQICSVDAINLETNEIAVWPADYVFSTMPVKELIGAMDVPIPDAVRAIAEGLVYRDFITVGLLLKKLKVTEKGRQGIQPISDNWIYIQEPDVKLGRLQIFNNWSPHMVADPKTVWLGLEYFCNEGDGLWRLSDEEIIHLAKTELARIGIIEMDDVLDATVLRMPKTYPAYFGSYDRFGEIGDFVDQFSNLFLIGRNGMHKYNNQDHSMLTAMTAVDNLVAGRIDKANIWAVNTEMEYHEEAGRQTATDR